MVLGLGVLCLNIRVPRNEGSASLFFSIKFKTILRSIQYLADDKGNKKTTFLKFESYNKCSRKSC